VEPENELQDGPARFLGLAGRVGVVLARTAKAGSRYIAYSSDVGEAFRPLVSPTFVRATYGIAYAYVLADVGFAVYGEHNRSAEKEDYDQRVARAGVETLTFQLLASIAVPSLIIHTAVHQAQNMAKRATKPTKLARYGPTALGLAIIPVLPFTIDSPIEHVIEEGFDTLWPLEGFRQGHESATDGVLSTGGDATEGKMVAPAVDKSASSSEAKGPKKDATQDA
jgi:fission process protein 1